MGILVRYIAIVRRWKIARLTERVKENVTERRYLWKSYA